MPMEGSSVSHVLSIYVANYKRKRYMYSDMYKPLEPFGSRIVDFMCLPSDIGLKCQK